ncbi:MAG TPA: ABC transporter permease, partial [Phytomonospora sp.]
HSLRLRPATHVATFLSMLLGATLLMSFGALLDTAGGAKVDPAGSAVLERMGLVVGGWSLLLVTFSVTAMVIQRVRQRADELALLKHLGATPGQLTWMIAGETFLLGLLALVGALVPAVYTGLWICSRLAASGQIAESMPYRFGGFAIHLGAGVTIIAATVASIVAARRATRGSAVDAAVDASVGPRRMSRVQLAAAAVTLFLGLDLAVLTATVMRGRDGFDPMATAGPASIWSSIGLALLAPVLIHAATGRLAGPLIRSGPAGYLAALHLRRRAGHLSTAAAPIILFTGIATATLYMTRTDNAARIARGIAKTSDYRAAESTNLLVVGMIVVFAAIMVANTLVAATVVRRREFGQQRLLGATPRQVKAMVVIETAVLVAAAALIGTVAALPTVIPFAIARQTLPAGGIAIWLGVIATAATIALASTALTTHRAMRIPALVAQTGDPR